jgi:hypothetical protein
MELEEARRQAAGLSPEMFRVVDGRISLEEAMRGKPTVSSGRKAAVLGAPGRVRRTPPGSKSGACRHRGGSGTWESPLSPCHITGMGDRVIKGPGVSGGVDPRTSPYGIPRTTEAGKVSGARATSEVS